MTLYAVPGAFPLGGFPPADSLSVADPLIGILRDPSLPREFLVRATPSLGSGLSFSGTTYINYGDVLDLGTTSSGEYEILFASSTLGTNKVLVGKKAALATGTAGWYCSFDASNNIKVLVDDGTHNATATAAGAAYLDGRRHRVTIKIARPTLSLLIDGITVASVSMSTVNSLANGVNFRVGATADAAGGFVGKLADLRAWATQHTEAAITRAAHRRLNNAEISAGGCQLYSKIDEGMGLVAADSNFPTPTSPINGTIILGGGAWTTSFDMAVNLSGGGYMPRSTETPYELFAGCVRRPYNYQADLNVDTLSGGTSAASGDIVINNGDGLHDAEATLGWVGALTDVYIGPHGGALADFTRISKGRAANIRRARNEWSIIYRDLRYRLARRLQTTRYKGFGAALYLNGTTSYVNATPTCPANSMAMEAWAQPAASIATQQNIAGFRNGAGAAGVRHFLVGVSGTDIPSFQVRNDAATAFIANGPVITTTAFHIAGVLDTSAMTITCLINGVPGTPVAVTGTFATVLSNFDIGRAGGSASNFFAGTVDEVRVWNVARTTQQIIDNKDKELLGTETGLVQYWKCNEGASTTLGNSVSGGAVGTYNGAANWASLLEGEASLFNVVKPNAQGKCRQVTPQLVDAARLVYQFGDGSSAGVDAARIGADPQAFNANLTDIYSAAPGAGQYNTCLAKSLVRFGAAPGTYPVTLDIRGDNGGALGYQDTAGGIIRKLAIQYGLLSDPADLDTATFTALAVKTTATIGRYFSEEINIDAAMDMIATDARCWWSPNRVDQVTVGRIEPPETQTATVAITTNDMTDAAYQDDPVGVRVGEVVLGYRPYYTALSVDQIAGAVTLINRDDYGQEYRYVRATDPTRTADADVLTVLTTIDDSVAAQTEADRLLVLWKVERRKRTISLDQGVLAYFIGAYFNATDDRYNLQGGKNYAVTGITEDMGENGQPDSLQVSLFG